MFPDKLFPDKTNPKYLLAKCFMREHSELQMFPVKCSLSKRSLTELLPRIVPSPNIY